MSNQDKLNNQDATLKKLYIASSAGWGADKDLPSQIIFNMRNTDNEVKIDNAVVSVDYWVLETNMAGVPERSKPGMNQEQMTLVRQFLSKLFMSFAKDCQDMIDGRTQDSATYKSSKISQIDSILDRVNNLKALCEQEKAILEGGTNGKEGVLSMDIEPILELLESKVPQTLPTV